MNNNDTCLLYYNLVHILANRYHRLATFIQSFGQQNTNNSSDYDSTITPSAVTLNGDFLSPSSLSSIDNGRGHVAAIRATGESSAVIIVSVLLIVCSSLLTLPCLMPKIIMQV